MDVRLLTVLLAISATGEPPANVAVVCPAEFRETMQPWLERRQSQGHVVEFLSNSGTAEDIKQRIGQIAKQGKLRFVVLVGDAPAAGSAKNVAADSRFVPAFRVPAKVNCSWGGGPDIATDNLYGDLDDDGVPDVAVGRLTAHSKEELEVMLKKVGDYEDCRDFGPWRTKLNFVAGQGGFGDLMDGLIDAAARTAITIGVPATHTTTLTNASWQSPNCPDPKAFHECCLERMNEGCLFWVFIGHGSPRSLQQAWFPDGPQTILRCEDCGQLHCRRAPIVLFFACYTGAFAEGEDCLAEELLRSKEGPVAVVGGSDVTSPYAMTILGRGAMHEYFVEQRTTLGELFLHAKRDMVAGDKLPIWGLIHALVAAAVPESLRPKEERREHLQLFNLFGDPTMTLHYPQPGSLTAPDTAMAGGRIAIQGNCPIDGPATVELVLRRDRLPGGVAERNRFGNGVKDRERFAATYRGANDLRLAATETQVVEGHFATELEVPANAEGACRIRVSATGSDDCAVAACNIRIDSPTNRNSN